MGIINGLNIFLNVGAQPGRPPAADPKKDDTESKATKVTGVRQNAGRAAKPSLVPPLTAPAILDSAPTILDSVELSSNTAIGIGGADTLPGAPVNPINDTFSDAPPEVSQSQVVEQSPQPKKTAGSACGLKSGDKLPGGYTILDLIGTGAMGAVYLAEGPNGPVVVKTAIPTLPKAIEFLRNESNLLQEGNGASRIPKILSFGFFNEGPYIVMGLLPGEPLSKAIDGGRRMPMLQGFRLFSDLVEGAYLHYWDRGILNRDIKPGNMMWDLRLGLFSFDWGTGKYGPDIGTGNELGQVVGTPAYLSQKASLGGVGGQLTIADEFFSLAASLHEAIYGRLPYESQDVNGMKLPAWSQIQLNPNISARAQGVFARMLNMDGAAPYTSGQELLTDMRSVYKEEQAAYNRFKSAVMQGKGTLIYFRNVGGASASFEQAVREAFPESNIYRCDREGMEGIFVFARMDENAAAKKAQRIDSGQSTRSTIAIKGVKISGRRNAEAAFNGHIQDVLNAADIASAQRGNAVVRASSNPGDYDIYLSSEGRFVSTKYINEKYIPQLLKVAEEISRVDEKLGEALKKEILRRSPEQAAQINLRDIRKIAFYMKHPQKMEYGGKQEDWFKDKLLPLIDGSGLIEYRLTEMRQAAVKAKDAKRWDIIGRRFGPTVADILKPRFFTGELGNMSAQEFEQFKTDVRSARKGEDVVLKRLRLNQVEGQKLMDALIQAEADYVARGKEALGKIREAQAQGKPLSPQLMRWLKAFRNQKQLRKELKINLQEVNLMVERTIAIEKRQRAVQSQTGEIEVQQSGGSVLLVGKASREVLVKMTLGEWAKILKLAKRYNLSPEQAARAYVLSRNNFATNVIVERFTARKVNEFLVTDAGQEFIRRNADILRNRMRMGGPALMIEVITLLFMEMIAGKIAIDPQKDPVKHLAFVIGLTHTFGTISRPLTQQLLNGPLSMIKTTVVDGAVVISFKDIKLPDGKTIAEFMHKNLFSGKGVLDITKRTLTFTPNMVKGMGPGLFTAFLADQLAVITGLVKENSPNRHLAGFIGFFGPTVAGIFSPSYARGVSLGTAEYELAWAAAGKGSRILLGLGRANAAAGAMFAVGFGFDLITMITTSSYDAFVAGRALDRDLLSYCSERSPWYEKTNAFWVTMWRPVAGRFIAQGAASKQNMAAVMRMDYQLSLDMQEEVRTYFKARLLTDSDTNSVDLSFALKPMQEGIDGTTRSYSHDLDVAPIVHTKYIPGRLDRIAEKYKKDYPVKYSIGDWTPARIAEDMRANGMGDVTTQDVEKVLKHIQAKRVQESVAFMVFVQSPVNDEIRGLFNKDGTLQKGKEEEFIKWVFGQKATSETVIQIRMVQKAYKGIDSQVNSTGNLENAGAKDDIYFAALARWARETAAAYKNNPADPKAARNMKVIEARINTLRNAWDKTPSVEGKVAILKELIALGDFIGAQLFALELKK
jgi:hypothetical protein